ncbi:MAG: hypothetical protein WA476_07945, partial [Acidobacteriaceae bacterium]
MGAPSARAQSSSLLPDAPRPQIAEAAVDEPAGADSALRGDDWAQSQRAPGQADPQAASPMKNAPVEKRKWAQYVDPGE